MKLDTKQMDTKQIKGLIFDLDGTLADTMPLHFDAWNDLGKPIGMELSHEQHLELAGMPTIEIAKKLAKERNIELDAAAFVAKKEKMFMEAKLPQVQPIASVVAFLYELHGKMPMAIGTGSTLETAEKVLSYLKITPYVQALVTADEVANHKPAPDTFLTCAEKLGIAPESCLVFEDANLGMEAAKNAGMQAVNILEETDETMNDLLNELKKAYICI